MRSALVGLVAGALSGTSLAVLPATAAVGETITGSAWQDYDANGVFDSYEQPLAGIEVYAYDSEGNVVGPVTTGADGTYSIATTSDAEQWRIEADVPDAPEWDAWRDGANGADHRSTVQFVTTVPAADVDFAFQVPGTYSENNPLIYLPEYHSGAADGPNAGARAGGVLRYEAESPGAWDTVPTTMDVPFGQVGATNGSAWQRATSPDDFGSLFVAAYVRRHSGLGPGGIGAIYQVEPNGADATAPTGTAQLFVDLTDYGIDLGPEYDAGAGQTATGIRPRPSLEPGSEYTNPSYDWIRDSQAWDKVGRTGLGTIAFSSDERYLFAVNLYNRSIVRIEVDKPATQVLSVEEFDLDEYFPDDGELRPYGVSANPLTNELYLTVTRTAELSEDSEQLHGYVYRFAAEQPDDLDLVLDFPLTWERYYDVENPEGNVTASTDYKYRFWTTDPAKALASASIPNSTNARPTPVMADAKYLHGNLVIGIRDLWGDTLGANTYYGPTPGNPIDDRMTSIRAGGEILMAAPNAEGTGWEIENNGVAGGVTGAGNPAEEWGPGGWKYFDDSWPAGGGPTIHDRQALGSLLVLPSRDDGVLSTAVHAAGGSIQVGVRRFYQATGAHYDPRGATTVQLENTGAPMVTAKGNGLGSMTALSSAAPIEIGNYVWLDIDKDGVQDADEPPVEGATVNLYAADEDGNRTGDPIATVLTDAEGQYYFTSAEHGVQAQTRYVIGVDNPADYEAGGVLENWVPTSPDTGDENSTDPDRNDSDGIVDEANGFPYAAVTTGDLGDNDHTFDFGFWYWTPAFDKSLVSVTENPEDDGTWEVVYGLSVTNEGPSAGEYDLSDDLTQMGEGIVLESATTSGPDGVDLPGGVALNEGFDGSDDQLVIADVPIEGAGMTYVEDTDSWVMGEPVTHEYTVTATVSLETDEAGVVVPPVENLTCQPAAGGGSAPGSGAYNAATLSPDGLDDLVDDACPSLPYVDIEKVLDGEPAPVAGEPGIWEVRYLLTVSNPSEVDTDYDLTDEFRFGAGMTLVEGSATVASTDPAGIEVSESWDGVEDTVVVEDEPIAAGGEHTYSVTARFALDLASVPAEPVSSDCELGAGEDGTGLRNEAGVSFNGYENVDDACAETGEPEIEKSVVSAEPIGEGRWEVVYGVEVSNLGVEETIYDLDDELRFDEAVTVESAEVTQAPDGVTLVDPAWDGAAQPRVADDVALLGNDDEGYAPHSYELTVVAEVPVDLVGAGGIAACVGGAGSAEPGALNNEASIGLEDERSKSDIACPPLPSFELSKTVASAPVADADGVFTIDYDVVMTNTGAAAGEYDLFDQLDYPEGVEITDVAVSETVPADLPVLEGFTGQGEQEQSVENQLVDDTELAAGASHTYRVRVSFVVDVDSEAIDPAQFTCEVAPGADGPGGLVNGAVADHNDLELQAEVCTPLEPMGDPVLDKKVLLPGETLDNAGEVTDTLYEDGDPQPREVSAGDVIQYGIVVQGHDRFPSTDVFVEDALPAGVAYAGDYVASRGSYDGTTWTIGDLAADEVVTLVIDVTVEPAADGTIVTNVAQLSGNGREIADDPKNPGKDGGRNTTPDDGYDEVDITVRSGDPVLDKKVLLPGETLDEAGEVTDTLYEDGTPQPREVAPGDVIQYGIVVQGHDTYPASDVSVADALPAGITYAGDYQASRGEYDGTTWTIGDLAAGEVVTLVIDVTVEPAEDGTIITNVAQLSGNGREIEDDPKNPGKDGGRNTSPDDGYDEVDITVRSGDPTLDKKVLLPGETLDGAGEVTDTLYDEDGNPQPREVSAGQVIQYGIVVEGHDRFPATDVSVADALPAGISYAGDYVASRGDYDGTNWTIGDLAAGEVVTLVIDVTVEPAEHGTVITNVAQLSGNGREIEDDPKNPGKDGGRNTSPDDGYDEVDITVRAGNPTLDKKVLLPGETLDNAGEVTDTLYDSEGNPQPRQVQVGDEIQYGIVVKGHDTDPAVEVAVEDVLPAGVAYAGDYEASRGEYDGSTWTIGDLAAGEVVTLVIDVTVDDVAAGEIVTNVAQLSANGEEVADDGERDGRNTDPSDGWDAVDITVGDLGGEELPDSDEGPQDGGSAPGGQLPQTGAPAVLLPLLAGLALAGAGTTLVIRRRRGTGL
ncbi:SdrD B-like domain-containing protein [Desertihabitans brevis]|uniref:SdrD B-like domain-containing protein n=1 Tax=Desertihabitans brevis TaxID=2268447 RepID=UPI001314BCA7|nr:SdrD B-like domain-containing protein [Desertihabitans brevis]